MRDVVRAYHALMARGEAGGVYNVCRGEAVSMQSLLDQLLSLATVPIAVTPDPQRMRPSDIAVSVGDPSKLRAATGWQPANPPRPDPARHPGLVAQSALTGPSAASFPGYGLDRPLRGPSAC